MLSYWLLVRLLIMRQTHWLFPNHIPNAPNVITPLSSLLLSVYMCANNNVNDV